MSGLGSFDSFTELNFFSRCPYKCVLKINQFEFEQKQKIDVTNGQNVVRFKINT